MTPFDDRIKVNGDGCWIWQGAPNDMGYGRVSAKQADGRSRYAHRHVFEALVGLIPDGLDLDHLCHNADGACAGGPSCLHRMCVNPSHLEPVTPRENLLRGNTTSAAHSAQTHCIHGHEFTPENTTVSKKGERKCRACNRRRMRDPQNRARERERNKTPEARTKNAAKQRARRLRLKEVA